MNDVRVVYRTHYQAIGLDLLDLTIRLLSPFEPANPQAAATRVSMAAKDVGLSVNPAAAGYLLGEMRELQLLNRDNAIANDAVTYYAFLKRQLPYDPTARLLFYFCTFFERDGAFLIPMLAGLKTGHLTNRTLFQTDFFEQLMLLVFAYYLDHSSSARQYAAVQQQRDDLLRKPLARLTRKHKLLFHLSALRELQLIEVLNGTYSLTETGLKLLRQCPLIDSIEATARRDDGLLALGADLYGMPRNTPGQYDLVESYRAIAEAGIKLLTVTQLLWSWTFRSGQVPKSSDVAEELKRMRQAFPGAVRLYSYRGRDVDSVQLDPSNLEQPGC